MSADVVINLNLFDVRKIDERSKISTEILFNTVWHFKKQFHYFFTAITFT